MLERIKALSVNVTNGAETLGALIYLVDAIVKSTFGISGRLRMPAERDVPGAAAVLGPSICWCWTTIQTQFDRFRSEARSTRTCVMRASTRSYYIDTTAARGRRSCRTRHRRPRRSTGSRTTCSGRSIPRARSSGSTPARWSSGSCVTRTLNSTNDFQVFGERFRNVARLAPAQAAYWVTTDCARSVSSRPPGQPGPASEHDD